MARGGSWTGVTSTTGEGRPVTVSSGISVGRCQENVVVSPPPRRGRGDRTVSGSESQTVSSASHQSMTLLVTASFTAAGTGAVLRTLPSRFDTLRSPIPPRELALGPEQRLSLELERCRRFRTATMATGIGRTQRWVIPILRDDPRLILNGCRRAGLRDSRSTGVRRCPRSRTQSSPSLAKFLTAPNAGAGSRSSGYLFTAAGESAMCATTPTGHARSYTFTPSGTADLSLSRLRSTAPGENEAYSRDRTRIPTGGYSNDWEWRIERYIRDLVLDWVHA